jgi:hypothetical protein
MYPFSDVVFSRSSFLFHKFLPSEQAPCSSTGFGRTYAVVIKVYRKYSIRMIKRELNLWIILQRLPDYFQTTLEISIMARNAATTPLLQPL